MKILILTIVIYNKLKKNNKLYQMIIQFIKKMKYKFLI